MRERKKEGVASARAQASFVKLWTPLRATLIKKRAFLIYTLTYYTRYCCALLKGTGHPTEGVSGKGLRELRASCVEFRSMRTFLLMCVYTAQRLRRMSSVCHAVEGEWNFGMG